MKKFNLGLKFATYGMAFALLLTLSKCGSDDDPAPDAVVGFDYDATTDIIGQAPLNVQFSNSSTNAVAYAWDFGDGTTSTEEAPAHTYTAGGVYTVTLVAKNADSVAFTDETDLELASPLVGTWQLDSLAENTVDSLKTKVVGAFEIGVSLADAPCPRLADTQVDWTGWDGLAWTNEWGADDKFHGLFRFWTGIFSGNYFGRKDLFENEFTFGIDGSYKVDNKGELRFPDFMPTGVDVDALETDDWTFGGVDLNAYKSNDTHKYTLAASADFPKQAELTLLGKGAYFGFYINGVFGTGTDKEPQDKYVFTISKVTEDQLIVFGHSPTVCASDVMVMKFKKVVQ